jgi:hypothetical protein
MSELFKYAGRSFTLTEIRNYLAGSDNPALDSLIGREFHLAVWLLALVDELMETQ